MPGTSDPDPAARRAATGRSADASEAARRLGESSGSASYHLRQLARYGLVEEAEGGRGRERPWRATALYTSWPNVAETPELAEASEAFERLVIGRYVERLEDWVTRRAPRCRAEWREAAAFGDTLLYLTVEELAALRDQLQSTGRAVRGTGSCTASCGRPARGP